MQLSRLFHSLSLSMHNQFATELLELNEETKACGLVLTHEDIERLMAARSEVLQGYARVELGIEVSKALIREFASSSFIIQENYTDVLVELQEMFYDLKNETEDNIGDFELIRKMKTMFKKECEGSLTMLRSKLEEYARRLRSEWQIEELSIMEEETDDWDLNR